MPAEQPANATIEIFRNVRTYRKDLRHESIKVLAPKGGRDLVMSVPAREYLAAQSFDHVVSDAFRYGHPVVTFPRGFVSLGDVLTNITNPRLFRLVGGRDYFFTHSAGNNTADLHAQVRARDAVANVLPTINPITP